MVSPELVSMIVGGARFKNKILFHDMSDNNGGFVMNENVDRLPNGCDAIRSELESLYWCAMKFIS